MTTTKPPLKYDMFAFSNDHFFVGFFKNHITPLLITGSGHFLSKFPSPKNHQGQRRFFLRYSARPRNTERTAKHKLSKNIGNTPTKWALTGYKWGQNPYQWPNKKILVSGVMPPYKWSYRPTYNW